MTTTAQATKRMSIREFRASLRADMDLPLIVTADGHDAFAVVSLDMLRGHDKLCGGCGHTRQVDVIQSRCRKRSAVTQG